VQIEDHLRHFFHVNEQVARVKRYWGGGFLIIFSDHAMADWVLHAPPPEGVGVTLVFHHWRRQAGVLFTPLCFKVLLSITNVYAHIWSEEVV
jgi:hypothetical protein